MREPAILITGCELQDSHTQFTHTVTQSLGSLSQDALKKARGRQAGVSSARDRTRRRAQLNCQWSMVSYKSMVKK